MALRGNQSYYARRIRYGYRTWVNTVTVVSSFQLYIRKCGMRHSEYCSDFFTDSVVTTCTSQQ